MIRAERRDVAMKQTKALAFCGIMTALGVVILLLGGFLGVGTYAAPMLVGLMLLPVGSGYGTKYHVLVWLGVGVLALILVSDVEESLMFLGFFGWYPILRPRLQRLPKVLGWVAKFALFNGVLVALEALVLLVLAPEALEASFLVVLLAMANLVFFVYDLVIPRVATNLERRLGGLMK